MGSVAASRAHLTLFQGSGIADVSPGDPLAGNVSTPPVGTGIATCSVIPVPLPVTFVLLPAGLAAPCRRKV